MSVQTQVQATPSGAGVLSLLARVLDAGLRQWISRRLGCGQLVIDMPTGHCLTVAGARPGPQARLSLHSRTCLPRTLFGGSVGFAESYMAGEWSSPNIAALLGLLLRNRAVFSSPALRAPRMLSKLRHGLNRNTRRGSRRNISAHYDLGNEFFAQWLDAGMNYSSALFSSADQTLEAAQDAKLDRIFDLLELSGGEKVLEIGCGWGGFAQRLIDRYRCDVTALTLSARQLEFTRFRLGGRDLMPYADVRLQDYRDVRGTYDRIVSIEMLEAVGAPYWPTYFKQLRSSLRPGGLGVLQVITIDEERFESYRRRPDFIQKHIFPGGMLPTTKILEQQIAAAGLRLLVGEHFGASYARTLEEWQRRFQRTWPALKELGFDDRFKRAWEYYLAYCQAGFEAGTVNVGFYKVCRDAAA
jgi:cyclopropane-fatty-acyl-phospholipid synthase